MSYKFSEELMQAIRDRCYKEGCSLRDTTNAIGISTGTLYSCKKRGTIGGRTIYLLKRYLPEFDFNKLEKTK